MPSPKKQYVIGDGLAMGKGGLEEQVYLNSYVHSECRPIKDLIPLWKPNRKFHKMYIFENWIEARNRLRKSNYDLGIALGHDFVEHVHREMCEMFVQKNFDNVYHPNYTLGDVRKAIGQQKRLKEMLLLTPRGSFKSTCNKVDRVNWMLNAPDCRQMILSAEIKLANKFLKEIKGYFYCPPNADPTYFQAIFPEYMLSSLGDDLPEEDEKPKKRKSKTEKENPQAKTISPLICPARLVPQEGQPSLWVNSMGANLSGWHTDLLAGDDCVSDANSLTEHTREQVKDKWDGALNLVDEWGFIDMIGTRYFPDDLYGERIKIMNEVPLLYLKRASWIVKDGFETVPVRELKEEMVILYFPEKITFQSLKNKLHRNERMFWCQQMNEPRAGEELICFAEEAMRRAHMPGELAPEGDIYITWDTSAGSKGGDFSCGAVGLISERGELFSIDNVYGKWRHSQLAQEVVKLGMKYPQAKCILIEDFVGSELFKREVQVVASEHGAQLPILWHPAPPHADAKRNRIKGLEILLTNGLLFFVSGYWTDELMKQFTKYTGEKAARRHDDIPDAIAYLQLFLPCPDYSTTEYSKLKAAAREKLSQAGYVAHIFNSPAPPIPVELEDDHEGDLNYQFFGGNGMRGVF